MPEVSDLDRLLSAQTVRELLDVSDRGLRRWIAAGKIPKPDLRIGRNLRWKAETIRNFVDNGGDGISSEKPVRTRYHAQKETKGRNRND